MSRVAGENRWDRRPFPGGPVAMLAAGAGSQTPRTLAEPILTVSTSGADYIVLNCQDLGPFLTVHSNTVFVTHNAASLHWFVVEALGSLRARDDSLAAWWDISKEYRLHAVDLLYQRVCLADDGRHTLPKSLQQLASLCSEIRLDENSSTEESLGAILAVYRNLLERADRITSARIDEEVARRESVEARLDGRSRMDLEGPSCEKRQANWRRRESEFGPLATGIDVQGAIAAHRASQDGLEVDPEELESVARNYEQRYARCSAMLRNEGPLRSAFHWTGNLIGRDGNGYLRIHNHGELRRWLQRRLDACRDRHGARRRPCFDENGAISRVPEHWGILTRCDPLLRAWADLTEAGQVAQFVRGERTVLPRYGVVPRIRAVRPVFDYLRRSTHSPFVPREDCIFVIGRMLDLELRCLAYTYESWTYTGWWLSGMFQAGIDPIEDAVRRLSEEIDEENCPAPLMLVPTEEGGVETVRQPLSWLIDRPDGPREWFFELDDERKRAVARLLLQAVPQGLDDRQTAELIREEVGLHEITEQQVHRFQVLIVSHIHWQLGRLLEDPTVDVIVDKVGMTPDVVFDGFWPDHHRDTWPFSLRNVLEGKAELAAFWERIRECTRGGPLEERTARMTPGLDAYEFFMTTNPVSPTGRVGRPVYWTERRCLEHLELADEVMKSVVFAVVLAGLRLVAVAGDEFVVEVEEDKADIEEQVTLVANRAAAGLLRSTAQGCCRCRRAVQWPASANPLELMRDEI